MLVAPVSRIAANFDVPAAVGSCLAVDGFPTAARIYSVSGIHTSACAHAVNAVPAFLALLASLMMLNCLLSLTSPV
jgi:hypothetical protein